MNKVLLWANTANALGVDYTCVLNVQFECAASRLLQWHAFFMCSKMCDQLHWMQQTLLQAMQCDVVLNERDITLHAALRAILGNQVKKQVGKGKIRSKTHVARHAAWCHVSEIGREFCCTSKTHAIAADGLLHIKTAHPKRKCYRPLSPAAPYIVYGDTTFAHSKFAQRHLPKDICPETFAQRYLPRGIRPETFPQNNICPDGHLPIRRLPRKTFDQNAIC
jgi:hypothetical protein